MDSKELEIIDLIAEFNEDALTADGFSEAIIGMASRINLGPVVAYDVEKIIEILMKRDNMDYPEAREFYEFNIVGGWHGEMTPVFVETEGFKTEEK